MLKVYPDCISIKTGIQNIDWFCCRILGHLLWSGEIGRLKICSEFLAKYLRFIKPLSKPDLRFPSKKSYLFTEFYIYTNLFDKLPLSCIFRLHPVTENFEREYFWHLNGWCPHIYRLIYGVWSTLQSITVPCLVLLLQNTNFVLKIFLPWLTVTWERHMLVLMELIGAKYFSI